MKALTSGRAMEMPVRMIRCVIMRGGTSKAPFVDRHVLPADPRERDALLLRLLGSPDPRQIDGLGGAAPLTSKVVIMDRSAPPGCDATYTYGRVSITEPSIGYASSCGNLAAAAGVYVVEEGWVPVAGTSTPVRLFDANTGRVLVIHVPTDANGYVADGDFEIPGVPGSGSEIRLDFAQTAGVATTQLLPLGPKVTVDVPALGPVEVSVVDVAKPAVFFRAEDVGLAGHEGPGDVSIAQFEVFWAIRDAVASRLGFGPEAAHLPTPVCVGPSATYPAFGSGREVAAGEMDLSARAALRKGYGMHQAFSGTTAVCTAVAARTPGTVVHDLMPAGSAGPVRLGHPSGVMALCVRIGAGGELLEASFSRTARRLMDGVAYLP